MGVTKVTMNEVADQPATRQPTDTTHFDAWLGTQRGGHLAGEQAREALDRASRADGGLVSSLGATMVAFVVGADGPTEPTRSGSNHGPKASWTARVARLPRRGEWHRHPLELPRFRGRVASTGRNGRS